MTSFELDAILFSAGVAAVTVLLCLPLAVLAASWASRSGWRGRWALDALLLLPLALSPAVIGWAVLLLLNDGGTPSSWLAHRVQGQWRLAPQGLVLVSACLVLPLMIRTMRPAFEAVDGQMVLTARTLGASRWSAWWSITVAQSSPMLLSAAALGFAMAWGETGAAVVLAAALPSVFPTELSGASASTVPLTVLSAIQTERGQGIALRLSLTSLGVAAAALLASEWARERWRRRSLPAGARGARA